MCVSVCLGHLNSGLLVCSVVSEWVSKEEGRESDYIVIYYCIYTFNIHYTYWGKKMTPEALCRPLVWYALHPIGMVWDVCSIPVGSPSFLATLMHCSTESRLLLFGDMKPPPGPQVTRSPVDALHRLAVREIQRPPQPLACCCCCCCCCCCPGGVRDPRRTQSTTGTPLVLAYQR